MDSNNNECIPAEIHDVCFNIESGYVWGRGMYKAESDAFHKEIRELFTRAGYRIIEPTVSGAGIEVEKGFTKLYCHPMELSGRCEENHIAEVETLLSTATVFKYKGSRVYGKIFPFTQEQEMEYYRNNCEKKILLELEMIFTLPPDRYRYVDEQLETLEPKYGIQVLNPEGNSPECHIRDYINTLYRRLVSENRIIEKTKKLGACNIAVARWSAK